MDRHQYYIDKHILSPQLSNRSDTRATCDQISVGGRGDSPGGGISFKQFPPDKSSKTNVCDKYKLNPTFSEHPAKWNKADYDFNINFLYDYMMKQKHYLKHEDYKYTQNKELLTYIKTQRQEDYDDVMWKKSETKRLRAEITGYEWQIRHQSALGETSAIQFAAEDKLNRDLKHMRKKMEREKELQLKKQTIERIIPEVIEAHGLTKHLFEQEQGKRNRLQQKSQWYDTELANIKEAFKKDADNAEQDTNKLLKSIQTCIHPAKLNVGLSNNAYANNVLPEINKSKNNMVAQKVHSYTHNGQIIEPANFVRNEYLPHPPSPNKNRNYNRFQRKTKHAIK